MTESITVEGTATALNTGEPNGTTTTAAPTVPSHFIGLPGVPETGPDGKALTRTQKRQTEKWLNETITRKEAASVFKRIASPYMEKLFAITSEVELGSKALFNVLAAKGLITMEEVNEEYEKLVNAAIAAHEAENAQKVAEQKVAFVASYLGRPTDAVLKDIEHMMEMTAKVTNETPSPTHVEFVADLLKGESTSETPRPEVILALTAYSDTLAAMTPPPVAGVAEGEAPLVVGDAPGAPTNLVVETTQDLKNFTGEETLTVEA